jgi:ABC-type cobalt transport system substrate-binding protein
LLAAFLPWLPSAPWTGLKPSRLWRGYNVVAVRAATVDRGKLLAALRSLGPGVVSETTSPVSFTDFEGVERCAYSELDRRIDPLDPRRDPYLEGLRGYFRMQGSGGEWKIAYIPARSSGASLFFRLAGHLGFPARGEWRLAEFDPLEKVFSILVAWAFAFLFVFSSQERLGSAVLLSLSSLLVWAPLLIAGGLAELSLCVLLQLAWLPLGRCSLASVRSTGRRGRMRPDTKEFRARRAVYIVASLVGTAVFLVAEGFTWYSLVGTIVSAVASLLLLEALPPLSSALQGRRRGRILFQPIPIVRPRIDSLRGKSAAFLFALVGIIVVGLLPLARSAAMPVPLPAAAARDFTLQSIGQLPANGRIERLPGLAEFVTHAAFQETLSFGRPWRLPKPDERVYQREYVASPWGGAVIGRARAVKSFGATWLAGLFRSAPSGSIEAMLIAQGRPVGAGIVGPGYALTKDLPVAIIALCILIVLFRRETIGGPLIRGMIWRINGAARRNQIP